MKNPVLPLACFLTLACSSCVGIYWRDQSLLELPRYNECERELELEGYPADYIEVLTEKVGLEKLSVMPLKNDDYIVRLYEVPSFSPESMIQVIVRSGEMIIERRAVKEMKVVAPPVIVTNLSEAASSRIREYLRTWDLMEMKNIVQCDSNGIALQYRDGVRYYMEARRGDRYHLVTFQIGNYSYRPYMELMALFEQFNPYGNM